MSEITYIRASCALCEEEITNIDHEIVIAILRNGKLICDQCCETRGDQILRHITVEEFATHYPETLEEIEDIEPSKEDPENES